MPPVPRHIAIIMDGNGRWATKRLLPRVAGHVKGVDAVRKIVEACVERGVEYLTLFAFSSENWRRPAERSVLPDAPVRHARSSAKWRRCTPITSA
jgi:undecaprenyl diphosphate synthase